MAEIKNGVTVPVFVRQLSSGIIQSLSLDSTIHPVSIVIIRNILGLFQIGFPKNAQSVYYYQETDPTGSYSAEYRRTSPSQRILDLTKRKTGYTSLTGSISDFDNAIIRVQFSGKIRADTIQRTIMRFRAKESKQTVVGNKVIAGSVSRFTATMVSDSAEYSRPVRSREYTDWYSLVVDVSALKMKRLKYERILGADNEHTILHRADSLQQLGIRWDDTLSDKLAALLNLRQDSCPLLSQYIHNDSVMEFAFMMISLIMAESETKIGEKHLLDAIEWRKNEPLALDQLLPLMVYINNPSIRTKQIITRLAFDDENIDSESQRTAQLALGNIARNLLIQNPGRAEKITNLIINKLSKINDSDQYLAVLGNSGSTNAIPEILKFYENGTIPIQCIALKSLRFITSSEVDKILKKATKRKSDESVKNTALDVLRFRKNRSNSL
ncbi:MAG: hypothetical protein IPM69_05950 [Ignavibacteria bacterium]|nr:hypothetical protein [Ignavibacteria bacterium]